jgi:hypothetical protein
MKKIVKILNEMVRDNVVRDYAIGGAIAVNFYTEPQVTMDIDIFVHFIESDSPLITLEPLYTYLKERGHKSDGEHMVIHGFPVQFLATDDLTGDAIDNADTKEIDGEKTKVFSKEYLAAIMVKVGRPKDKIRLALLLELEDFDNHKFEAILTKFDLISAWSKLKVLYE